MRSQECHILRVQKTDSFESTTYGEQRTYTVSDVNCVTHARITGTRWAHLLAAVFLGLLFAGVASAQEQPAKTFRIPFHTVNSMILLDATVNGKRAVLMLDTGANGSIVDAHTAGFDSDKLSSVGAAGARAACSLKQVRLKLENYEWFNPQACVMDLASVERNIGTHIDGFLGQDVLREFSSVRINYKSRTIELEE